MSVQPHMPFSITTSVALLLSLSTVAPISVQASSFLEATQARESVVSVQASSEELQAALGAVLGCTGSSGSSSQGAAHTGAIRQGLLPMWRSLPKNQHGRVEWKLLRYIAHRHFMQRFHVLVRGMEPTIRVNGSHSGDVEILSRQAPALAQQINGPQAEHGFSLEDAVVMVAALEQLLFDSDSALLELIYRNRRIPTAGSMDKMQLQGLMKDYMVYWMIGDDQQLAATLADNPKLLEETIPHWTAITAMVEGSVRALEFSRQRGQERGAAHMAFESRYTFEDALEVAGSIGRSFGSFWESQCEDTKASLVRFDSAGTGRVRLPHFYAANKDGEWRFGESEAYLRELGALDETSAWRGKQVIVSNYMQAASNCVVTRPHYLVCCMMECESILGEVEAFVGSPMATVSQILEVVGNMTDSDDEPARLDDALQARLLRVAQTHAGHVPLHGRLFAQFLHYAFPRECAFPHKAGDAVALTPSQFGDESIVSAEEVSQRVADDVVQQDLEGRNITSEHEQGHRMSQWSEDEELLADYSQELRAPWGRSHVLIVGGAATVLVGLLWAGTGKARSTVPRTHSV